jgi:hypothetical protein
MGVVIHNLVCPGTVDETVLRALKGKNKSQEGLIEAVKEIIRENLVSL